jgi:hypothetical protein
MITSRDVCAPLICPINTVTIPLDDAGSSDFTILAGLAGADFTIGAGSCLGLAVTAGVGSGTVVVTAAGVAAGFTGATDLTAGVAGVDAGVCLAVVAGFIGVGVGAAVTVGAGIAFAVSAACAASCFAFFSLCRSIASPKGWSCAKVVSDASSKKNKRRFFMCMWFAVSKYASKFNIAKGQDHSVVTHIISASFLRMLR